MKKYIKLWMVYVYVLLLFLLVSVVLPFLISAASDMALVLAFVVIIPMMVMGTIFLGSKFFKEMK